MEEVTRKVKVLLDVVAILADGIAFFYECEELFETNPIKQNERMFLSARDSVIQRFEYCIDLFWRTLKTFFDNENIALSIISSREIIRVCVTSRFLSEEEGSRCMHMVAARNKTSHIYHEAMAEEIAQHVPEYYKLMQHIAERMHKKEWHEKII